MKIRSLHPEFFSDAKVCALAFPARLLFAGLWCHSDDYGRGRWLPKSIEGDVFPRDDVDIQLLLGDLVEAGLVRQYEVDGEGFYEIPNWEKYQSPKYRAKTSIPDPPKGKTPGHTDPGQLGDNPARVAQDFSPGEGEGEGEGEGVGEGVLVLAPKPARQRDEVWDALVDCFGEPTTDTNRRLRGKIVASLKRAGATAQEVYARHDAWPAHFPDAVLTETAFEKHWDRLGRPVHKASTEQVEAYEMQARWDREEARARELDAQRRGLGDGR